LEIIQGDFKIVQSGEFSKENLERSVDKLEGQLLPFEGLSTILDITQYWPVSPVTISPIERQLAYNIS
jgi:hypothetical protein